jgi:regulator of replication initiation timing
MNKRLQLLVFLLIQIQFVAICVLIYFHFEMKDTIDALVEENSALQMALDMLKYYYNNGIGKNI